MAGKRDWIDVAISELNEMSPGDSDTAKKAKKDLASLRSALADAAAVLKRLQWRDGHGNCPVCGWNHKHKPDCLLAALLRRIEG